MGDEVGSGREAAALSGLRTFIVPPDIVPVKRVSPIPVKKRTVCRPKPDGEAIDRSGGREWFSDRLFVECTTRDARTAYGSSFTAHASCAIGLLVLLSGGSAPTTPVRVSTPMVMPAFVAMGGGGSSGGSAAKVTLTSEPRPAAPAKPRVVQNAAKPAPSAVKTPEPTPLEPKPLAAEEPDATTVSEPEPPAETVAPAEGAGGAGEAASSASGEGGGSGGPGGAGTGTGSGNGVGSGSGPYRLGRGIDPPRKIKDVPPAYTSAAMAARVVGTVALEAIVGVDGRVGDVKVVRSIPLLDQAAIDCVKQWEFAPARMNGQPVPVIVTILVQFAIR